MTIEAPADQPTPAADGRTVLVIDDDEGDCCLVEDILTDFKVIKAIGGEAGIRILSEQRFPVVITDLKMPDVDGFGIIDHLNRRHPDTLIIVISGYASIDNVIKALRRGAYDYIMKPFASELLIHTVRRAFDYIALSHDRIRAQSFDMLNQIATTTAHEVFQPLTVLMGQAREIEKTAAEAETRSMAENVLIEARKIREIITKMENLNSYITKTFPGGHTIIDIDRSSE